MAKYELKVRAARMGETRLRIIEATMRLHTTIGPARTSIMAVAEAAGVQRHTVYSHFPDEKALFVACGGLFYERHPYPPTEPWLAIDDPAARVRRALGEMYSYFRANERELWPVVRDAPLIPHLVGRRFVASRGLAVAAIVHGWRLRGSRGAGVRALLDLALRFETWRALTTDSGLSDEDAAATMAVAVLCAAGKA
ncbi:MAG TPA: helix-turn-helix domain-containing protein [Candidatus Limnocylindria bacterium]